MGFKGVVGGSVAALVVFFGMTRAGCKPNPNNEPFLNRTGQEIAAGVGDFATGIAKGVEEIDSEKLGEATGKAGRKSLKFFEGLINGATEGADPPSPN